MMTYKGTIENPQSEIHMKRTTPNYSNSNLSRNLSILVNSEKKQGLMHDLLTGRARVYLTTQYISR